MMDIDTAALGECLAESITSPITREQLAQYAAASGDSNPLHLDPAFAKKAGFEDVIVHGMLGMAVLGRLLSAHFAAHTVHKFDARFVAVLPVGETLRCRARLASREDDGITLDLEALDGQGRLIINGSAQLAAGI